LPAVGFDSPGVNERITPGVNGLLVPPGGDLSEAFLRLVRDGDERRRLGAAARRGAESQDWQPIFDALEDRYRALVQAPGKRDVVHQSSR
jgi:glycosyltransferase involved in cell wall biosynthesis